MSLQNVPLGYLKWVRVGRKLVQSLMKPKKKALQKNHVGKRLTEKPSTIPESMQYMTFGGLARVRRRQLLKIRICRDSLNLPI